MPSTIQHGLTAAHICNPVCASPCSRHQLSTWARLPASTSYRRNVSTRAGHEAGTRAIPIARFRSAVRRLYSRSRSWNAADSPASASSAAAYSLIVSSIR